MSGFDPSVCGASEREGRDETDGGKPRPYGLRYVPRLSLLITRAILPNNIVSTPTTSADQPLLEVKRLSGTAEADFLQINEYQAKNEREVIGE